MIIVDKARIYDVQPFLAGLQQAAAGVVRVASPRLVTQGTAWLIGPTLAIYVGPAYRQSDAAPDASWACSLPTATDPNAAPENVPAQLAGAYELGPEHLDVVAHLLRLARPLPGQALTLGLERPAVNDHLFALHYPQAAPSQKLSFGPLMAIGGTLLRYQVDTMPGSGGAPLFDAGWRVIGVHYASGPPEKSPTTAPHNVGVALYGILNALRAAPEWAEIAEYHRLADVATARAGLEPSRGIAKGLDFAPAAPLRAAVLWSFDPAAFAPDEVETLRPLVSDPAAARWTLRADERQRLLREAETLKACAAARGDAASDDARQRVIDRILDGPPYPLGEIDEADLPYWLQAVRWFEGLAPELPTAGQVNRELERRRVRSRLRAIATDNFRGREDELATLKSWYAQDAAPPMVITGIGGVGKSALLGHFALSLPDDAVLLWLDFDRADIAPDDAVSMLRLLAQQTASQVEGFAASEPTEEKWQEAAHALGAALAATTVDGPAPLLALDGFEVAQHVRQYGEIWALLEALLADAPQLRVVVSGRAPVPDLKLAGRASQSIHLTGLARPDAEALLVGAGVNEPALVAAILDITQGVPLMLLLAVYWRRAGGDLRELPKDFPRELISGFLYQRILDRVMDESLKPLARSALVLRRLTVELLADALAPDLPADADPADVFERLSRELALVERTDAAPLSAQGVALAPSAGALILRPEVRSATLRLLEREDATFVRRIDERAAAWYAGQDPGDPSNVAELVYHRLRLGDVDSAAAAWRVECANLLLRAEEDLPPGAGRDWLLEHLQAATTGAPSLEAWEKDAVERMRGALGRGLLRVAPGILAERGERSANSPMMIYDAFDLMSNGDPAGALERLRAGGPGEGTVGRDRALLAALLSLRAGDRRAADGYLAQVEDEAQWRDRPGGGSMEALAVTAARARLTVDMDAELELLERLNGEDAYAPTPALRDVTAALVAPSDVALPALASKLAPNQYLESLPSGAQVAIPRDAAGIDAFVSQVRYLRRAEREGSLLDPELTSLSQALSAAFDRLDRNADLWDQRDLARRVKRPLTKVKEAFTQAHGRKGANAFEVTQSSAVRLALLGERRWALATSGLFLGRAAQVAQTLSPDDPLALAVAASLAAFVGAEASGAPAFSLLHGDRALAQIVSDVGMLSYKLTGAQAPTTPGRDALIARVRQVTVVDAPPAYSQYNSRWTPPWEASAIGLYLYAPDPLELLVRRAIGLPDSLPL